MEMKEEEIRPQIFTEKLKEYLAKDRALWLKNEDMFERVNCPACGSSNTKDPIKVRKLTFETCTNCATVFYNPRPTVELMHEYYAQAESYNFWAEHIFPASENSRREKIFIPLVKMISDFIKKYKIETEVILEIGAGFGIFCEELTKKKLFKKVIAVEPTPMLAQKCMEKGLTTIPKPYEKIDIPENSANIIASFEVIEHLHTPKDFLKKCYNLLKNSGLLILTCPNIKGFDFEVLGKQIAPNFGSEHINMFHPASMSILLKSTGFKVLQIKTTGKLDAEIVRNQILQGNYSVDNNAFLKRILIDEWETLGKPFQKFLAENGLSSNMLIVAQKQI